MDKIDKQIVTMDYKEEAIACVKGNVLQMHKQIYAKYNGDVVRGKNQKVRIKKFGLLSLTS